jgi:predicted phage tail protein
VDFSPGSLFLNLAVGLVGFGLLVYGRKSGRWPQAVAGGLLMVYPYFVSGFWSILLVGAAIGGGLWLLLRMGY